MRSVLVRATDGGTPALWSTLTLTVAVRDVNDNPPLFLQLVYDAAVREDAVVGARVAAVEAVERDVGSNAEVSYSIIAIAPPQTLPLPACMASRPVPDKLPQSNFDSIGTSK